MSVTEFKRMLQDATESGGVARMSPAGLATFQPKRRRGVVRPFVVRAFINGGSDWYDDAAFYYRHDAVWWAENMADDPERSSVVDVRYDDN